MSPYAQAEQIVKPGLLFSAACAGHGQGRNPPADAPGLEATTPPPPSPLPPPPCPFSDGPNVARKKPSPTESMAKRRCPTLIFATKCRSSLPMGCSCFLLLPPACATEEGKRELLVSHGWTGQGQRQLRVESFLCYRCREEGGLWVARGYQRHHLGLGERSFRS